MAGRNQFDPIFWIWVFEFWAVLPWPFWADPSLPLEAMFDDEGTKLLLIDSMGAVYDLSSLPQSHTVSIDLRCSHPNISVAWADPMAAPAR